MKKRLMIIVPNLQGGGQERIAALTSKILEDNYDIVFVIFDDTDSKYKISDTARYVNLRIPSSKGKISKFFNVLRRVARVKDLRKRERIDYCFSFGRTANIINCLSQTSGKTIVSIRNTNESETGRKGVINNLICRRSDVVVCLSEGLKNRLIDVYPEIAYRTFTLYNPCDIDRILSTCENISRSKGGHMITACGRLQAVKCYKNLFNAVKMVRDKYGDTRLLVLGDGDQRKELEKYILENDMRSYITLNGFVNDPFTVVAKSDLFVFSSAREGFGNVLVEALACAVPVVSTNCAYGPGEILSGTCSRKNEWGYEVTQYGILTPPFAENSEIQKENERIFADAIIRVFEDESLRESLSQNGPRRANDFSEQKYKDRIIWILEHV